MSGHANKQEQQQKQQQQMQNNQIKNNNKILPSSTNLKINENSTTSKNNIKSENLNRATNFLNGKIKTDSSQMNDNKVQTPNSKNKQFVPLKSPLNSRNQQQNGINQKTPNKANTLPLIKNNNNNERSSSKNGPRGSHVDIHELNDKFLLSNRNLSKQDTYARTQSVTRDSWQVQFKECMRHHRLVKDNNLEKTCDSCNIGYVLCDACRSERNIPFSTAQVCIDCAPAAYAVRGLIEKRDKLIRELHYNTQKLEDDWDKIKRETERLRGELDESENLRETMQEDYRKSVADCIQRENENVELVQNLANRIREIHSLESSLTTNQELMEAMLELLRSGMYSDCTISLSSSGNKYPLHRSILAARSPYFRTLLESVPSSSNQNQKNQKGALPVSSNTYSLDNIDSETMDQLLKFVYCGKCDELKSDSVALKLYTQADKFSLPSLKELIISYFINRLDKFNWTEIAASTQEIQNSSNKFKKYLYEFVLSEIKRNSIDIESDNPQWLKIKQGNPAFAVEILEKMMKTKNENKKKAELKQADESLVPDDYPPESVGDLSELNTPTNQQQKQPLKPITPVRRK